MHTSIPPAEPATARLRRDAAAATRRTRRSARTLATGAVLASLAALGATPAGADAATYSVWACNAPSGPVGISGEWTFLRQNMGTAASNMENHCLTAALGNTATFTATGALQGGGAESRFGWSFSKPANTNLVGFMHRASVTGGPGDQSASLPLEIDTDWGGSWHPVAAYAGPQGMTQRYTSVPASGGTLRYVVVCRTATATCAANQHQLTVDELRVDLDDYVPPQADLFTGVIASARGYRSGTIGLTANAWDAGSGLYRSSLTVDGAPAASHVVTGNGDGCGPLPGTGGTSGFVRGFASATPCVPRAHDTIALDTTALADGAHAIGYALEDAAGNVTGVATFSVRVNNPGGALPDTACTDGIDNDGDGAVDYGADAGCTAVGDGGEVENPVSVGAPALAAANAYRLGSTLSRVPGSWNDAGAGGGATSVRWQAARYDGAAPADIAGASAATLGLNDAALVGRRIRVVETRVTSQGVATATSELSPPVARADGTLPACADGVDNDQDNAVDADADTGCTSRMDATEDRTSPDEDLDGDGIANGVDADIDGDGIPNADDPDRWDRSVTGHADDGTGSADDFDHDGTINRDDADDDGDGIADRDDPAPFNALLPSGSTAPAGDYDGDGVPNASDPDDDGDGIADAADPAPFNHAVPAPAGTAGTVTTTTTTVIQTAPGSPVTVAGPPNNGRNASAGARVVEVIGRRSRTLRYGATTVFRGRLVNESGQPITGAALAVAERGFVPRVGVVRGAEFRPVIPAKPLVTDGRGRFRYVVPAGPSRVVRVGYKANTGNTSFAATEELTLAVISKGTLKASRKFLRNGQSVAFKGRVLGGRVPRTGVQIDLQAKDPRKGWITFKTVRTRPSGAFSARYRFVRTHGVHAYVFRAQLKADSGWPWLPSATRTVTVVVKG